VPDSELNFDMNVFGGFFCNLSLEILLPDGETGSVQKEGVSFASSSYGYT